MGEFKINNWDKGFSFFPKNPETDFPVFDNVKVEGNLVKPRNGRVKYPAISAETNPVTGLHVLADETNGLEILIAFKDQKVWKSIIDWTTGTWTAVTGGLTNYNNTYTYHWRFAEYYDTVGRCVVAVNGVDVDQEFYYDTTPTFANLKARTLAGSPPIAAYVVTHNDRIVLASGNTIYWSDFNNHKSYPGANLREIGTGARITGLHSIMGDLIIVKEEGIYRISGDPLLSAPLEITVDFQGSSSAKAQILIGGALYYYWAQAIYRYPAQKIVQLDDDYIVNPNSVVLDWHEKESTLYIYCTTSITSGINDTLYMVNLSVSPERWIRDPARAIYLRAS